MRTIKFRGKDRNGMWVYGDLRQQPKDEYCPIGIYIDDPEDWRSLPPVDPATVGQFTGLCDKNGKEIYEGDIVKDRNGGVDVITWDSLAFNLCVAYASSPNGVCANFFTTNPLEGLEVIGNIHDNHELLKTARE